MLLHACIGIEGSCSGLYLILKMTFGLILANKYYTCEQIQGPVFPSSMKVKYIIDQHQRSSVSQVHNLAPEIETGNLV